MTTLDLGLPTLVGMQNTKATARGDKNYHAVHFCVMYPQRGQQTVRIMVEDGTGYDSLDEAIASLPEPLDRTVKELQALIAKDYGFGMGQFYPEYNVVAKSNNYVFDKPFAEYQTSDGKTKIVKHPFADLMVRKVKEG
jgi:DNA modification methylase